MIYNWAFRLEHRSTVHLLSKAFDSVPHERMFLKFNAIGITGSLQKWLRSFLTARLQRVVINGCYPEWLPVFLGSSYWTLRDNRVQYLDPGYCSLDLQEAVSYSELNVLQMMWHFIKKLNPAYSDCDLGQITALVHQSVRLYLSY